MTTDPAAARYRRRRRWPMLVVIGVLFAAGLVVWFQALKPAPALAAGCNTPSVGAASSAATNRSRTSDSAPATPQESAKPSRTAASAAGSSTAVSTSRTSVPTSLGAFTDKNTLARIRPTDPSTVPVNVFNASSQRGMAKTVSDEMRSVGFESIGKVADDPLYKPDGYQDAVDLRCVGEIRYGNAGVASARTALLMVPCAQLVVDNRVDDSVDIVIGALYTFAATPDAVKTELNSIKQAAAPPAVVDGRTIQMTRSVASIPPLPTASCPG